MGSCCVFYNTFRMSISKSVASTHVYVSFWGSCVSCEAPKQGALPKVRGHMLLRTGPDNINFDLGRSVLNATSSMFKCQAQELLFEAGAAERGLFNVDASKPTATLTN